ncbi:MAG: outer membrane protein assembly factor BamB family protein [Planctomycetota bacterium]|jgi:outer membrane protein assembly factor BamB
MKRTSGLIATVAFAFLSTPCAWSTAGAAEASRTADASEILEASSVKGGLVVHVGCGDGRLTAALRPSDRYLVQGLDTDEENVAKAREYLLSEGRYGDVSVRRFDGRHLPYADNLVNLLIAEDPGQAPMVEVLRVLAPNGVAYVEREGQWTKKIKPWPKEIDDWTHWLHGPDGNAVADDRIVGPPRHVRWLAPPRWQRHHEATPSTSAVVSSGGRLFAVINEAPAGIDGMPDRWSLVARDAFNGKLLWKRPIAEWGWSQWSDHSYGHGRWNHPTHIARRLVAVGDRVYVTLGFNAPLTALDAATGRTLTTYRQTELTDEILHHEGTLVLAVNTKAQGPGRIEQTPPVEKEIVAVNAATGDILWRTGGFLGIASKADAIERVTHLEMVLGGGKLFCIEEDAVVGVDLQTGKRLWRADRAPRQRPVTYGSYYFTNLCSMVYHDGIVLFMEPDPTLERQPWNASAQARLLGISARTGEILWTRDCGMWGHYNQGDVFVIDNLAWVHDGQSFSVLGLDPHTGETQRTVGTQEALDQGHHHRCYRNKATVRYFVTGRRGVEFIDVDSGETLRHHWTRGTCRYGVLPCNGLLYVPPHPCICYITAKLNGFWALAPESRAQKQESNVGKQGARSGQRLERGPAFGDSRSGHATPDPGPPTDWPTYRHDAARSGCAGSGIAAELKPAWNAPIGGRLTGPVIADGRLFAASVDAHTVWAIDADDGGRLWSYTAGGRIDTPPTVYGGLLIFGSADGWVYCLRAGDGELVWRLRAAPHDLRIVANDQLESPWPVHGSVLIQDGVAYFAAGRSSFLDGGIHVYAVRPETGEILQQQRIYSIDPETGDMVQCRLPYDMPPDALGALPDVLVGDGDHVFMRHLEFDPKDLSYASAAPSPTAKRGAYPAVGEHLTSVAGLLDDCWFSQTYWTVDGKAHGKLLVFDANAAYGVKPFAGTARHSRAIFRPGANGYTLFANERPGHRKRWSIQVPVRVRAMVLAGSTLLAAGAPDVVDPDDPWSAFDGRKGSVLWVISTADGEKVWQRALPAPPVFDGMAAADGRLYVAMQDGSIACFGD